MEIGVCRRGHGTMRLEDDMVRYESGMISIIPANYPHNTIPDIGADNCWEYLFVDPEKILLLFMQMISYSSRKFWKISIEKPF
ncbi:MAG: AraC family ligand binding domain-containing protein [Eubacterium ramulus]